MQKSPFKTLDSDRRFPQRTHSPTMPSFFGILSMPCGGPSIRTRISPNGAVILVDYRTMQVKRHVGSATYFENQIDGHVNGLLGRRSPGSALKPFIYALAIGQGLIHPRTMLKDTAVWYEQSISRAAQWPKN